MPRVNNTRKERALILLEKLESVDFSSEDKENPASDRIRAGVLRWLKQSIIPEIIDLIPELNHRKRFVPQKSFLQPSNHKACSNRSARFSI